jgi:hypothetical protein
VGAATSELNQYVYSRETPTRATVPLTQLRPKPKSTTTMFRTVTFPPPPRTPEPSETATPMVIDGGEGHDRPITRENGKQKRDFDASSLEGLCCPICLEPWASQGDHQTRSAISISSYRLCLSISVQFLRLSFTSHCISYTPRSAFPEFKYLKVLLALVSFCKCLLVS